MTINEYIQCKEREFRLLPPARKAALAKEAQELIEREPAVADYSNWLDGLSPRQVIACFVLEGGRI